MTSINVKVVSALGDGITRSYDVASGATVGEVISLALGREVVPENYACSFGTSPVEGDNILESNGILTIAPKKIAVG